jgi:predicted alpha-1,6-mannanase (GH76 family)
MTSQLRKSADSAVVALQRWYGADSFAQSAGIYHWDDPNLGDWHDVLASLGYLDVYQDMERWWNSANAITALIDYMAVTGDRSYLRAVEYTFTNAPRNAYRPNIARITEGAGVGGLEGAATGAAIGEAVAGPPGAFVGAIIGGIAGACGGGRVAAASSSGRIYNTNFLDDYYDDDGWWALAWVSAYDLTNDVKFLSAAVTIFDAMNGAWDDGTCNGGIWWDKSHTQKNAIANELYITLSAALYNRYKARASTAEPLPSTVTRFLAAAEKGWRWFVGSGLISSPEYGFSPNLINDQLTLSTCQNDHTFPVWSYNQGVILRGLCELTEATGDPAYIAAAQKIADAFVVQLVTPPLTFLGKTDAVGISGVNGDGILTEWNDILSDAGLTAGLQDYQPNPSADSPQFQGIFVRNLAYLYTKTHALRYRAFILKNAASAMRYMNASSQFGANWAAPVDTPDFVRQCSGVDLLNAALLVTPVNIAYIFPLLLGEK